MIEMWDMNRLLIYLLIYRKIKIQKYNHKRKEYFKKDKFVPEEVNKDNKIEIIYIIYSICLKNSIISKMNIYVIWRIY